MNDKIAIGIPVKKPKENEEFFERDNFELNINDENELPLKIPEVELKGEDIQFNIIAEEDPQKHRLSKPRFAIGHRLSISILLRK